MLLDAVGGGKVRQGIIIAENLLAVHILLDHVDDSGVANKAKVYALRVVKTQRNRETGGMWSGFKDTQSYLYWLETF